MQRIYSLIYKKMKVLLVNGYEFWESSPGLLNATLVKQAKTWCEKRGYIVKYTIVDQAYDEEEEVQKILWADVIIYFSPVYWMSITSKLKSYFDHVYAKGRGRLFKNDGRDDGGQYGSGGLLQSKKYILVTTWNAPEMAFNNSNQFLFQGKSVDDVFLNFHAMQKFVGMQKLKSFSLFNVKKKPEIENFMLQFQNHLDQNI